MLSLRRLSDQPFFRSRQLSIRGIGVREVMPASYIQRPKGTGDYLFMLFHDAVDCGPIGGKTPLAPSSMMLWSRGAAHYYGNTRTRWSHSWIHCDGSVIADILRETRVVLDRPLRLLDPSSVDRCLFDLLAEITGPRSADPVIVRNLLENMLREIARADWPSSRPPIPERIAQTKAHIDANYDRRTTLSELAHLAGLSPRHFCTEFTRHYGVPPVAYLIHCRLRAAATLVRGTRQPIGEIGRRVGYQDPYYFSKHFKAYFGVSPRRLRA